MGIGGQVFTAHGRLLGAIAIYPGLIGLIGESMMLAGGPHLRERFRPGSSFRVALALWRAGKTTALDQGPICCLARVRAAAWREERDARVSGA
jgi:hypothetical protein